MQPFTRCSGLVLPIDRSHVDTDAILPKPYLKSIQRSGFGAALFADWRYLDAGEPDTDHSRLRINPDCMLNQPRYQNAAILFARENFGCGSSREHAVWALVDYGIRVVIAPSFADIFADNALNNGLLVLTLAPALIDQLFAAVHYQPGYGLSVDLEAQTIATPRDEIITFAIDPFRRHRLLAGLDEIDLTLCHTEAILAYEQARRKNAPWLF